MGSSARKKAEKKKDFQKTKMKVGKTKAKASNFTDTSFKSKAITMNSQSLLDEEPDADKKFKDHLGLVTSKNDKQRKEAVAFLTTQLSKQHNPVGTNNVLTKVLPLASDSSTPVRKQLLLLLEELPGHEVKPHVDQALRYIRSGMTHLSADISNDSVAVMEWLLEVAGEEVVSTAGGWVKTLDTFNAMMGWTTSVSKSGWSSGSGAKITLRSKDAATQAKQINALAHLLRAGLEPPHLASSSSEGVEETEESDKARWAYLYRLPKDPKSFDRLNLNGVPTGGNQIFATREERQQVFKARYYDGMSKGAAEAKNAGGVTGRAAVGLQKAMDDNLDGEFEGTSAMDIYQELANLW